MIAMMIHDHDDDKHTMTWGMIIEFNIIMMI